MLIVPNHSTSTAFFTTWQVMRETQQVSNAWYVRHDNVVPCFNFNRNVIDGKVSVDVTERLGGYSMNMIEIDTTPSIVKQEQANIYYIIIRYMTYWAKVSTFIK